MTTRLESKINHTYDKYAYVINNPIRVKILYGFGIISWTLLLYGYIRFLNLNPLYWMTFGVVIGIISIYNYLNYGINLFYKKFDVARHNRSRDKYWKSISDHPTIDIYLPVCGEHISLLEQTFSAVQGLRYQNKKVYVLDDKGEKSVENLASLYKFQYLSRPDKGYMKKAGNLKFAFEHSNGEFYVVFDADFSPSPDFINELLPYMNEPTVGIVQSPQYFEINQRIHERSPIEYGSANIQEDFYRIIQPARDVWGGAICVGSNAIYRRQAIEKIGGPHK